MSTNWRNVEMTMRSRTLPGDYPGTSALKKGSIRSNLVAFDFIGHSPTHWGFVIDELFDDLTRTLI